MADIADTMGADISPAPQHGRVPGRGQDAAPRDPQSTQTTPTGSYPTKKNGSRQRARNRATWGRLRKLCVDFRPRLHQLPKYCIIFAIPKESCASLPTRKKTFRPCMDAGPETAARLHDGRGILNTGISSINQKIPANASMANKLVSESTLYEVIAQVIGAIDATFNVQSVDGHVTLHITQLDGEITSVQVQTSDIASAADLTLLASRVTTAEGNINTLSGRISTNESDISDLQDAYEALTQSALVIVQPTDTWPVASPATKTIYRVVDRVNTPPQYYSDYMWNGTSMVLMATYNNVIDDVPTAGSPNLVKSSGVYNFAHDLAFITNGIPTLDIINNTFTLPSGSYITAKGITILSLEQDIIWRRTDAISLNAGGYLVLNLSTLEKRTVPATLDPECNANECVVALVDWWNDVIKGNFSRYYINQNYVDFKLLSKKSLPRPVFWRQGHIEIIKNRTNNGSISVRVLEDCMFFLTDRFVTITASETYIDLSTATVALLCIEYTTDGNYILSLQNYDNYYKENLYVITTIFYNYLGDAADDGYEGLISDIVSSALAKITYLRSTKVAKDWAYKTKLPEYNKNVFGNNRFISIIIS